MMLYTVQDLKAGYCLPIFEARSDAHALTLIGRGYNCRVPLYQYPKDYRLIRLGSFDDQTCVLTPDRKILQDVYTCLLEAGINPDKTESADSLQDAEIRPQEAAEDVTPMEDK